MSSRNRQRSVHLRLVLCTDQRRWAFARVIIPAVIALSGIPSFAQATSDMPESIRGTVINSVTHEPISRALVSSPDNRFATMTNSEGRFEFALSRSGASETGSNSASGPVQSPGPNRPYMLVARKPGFIADQDNPGQNLQNIGSNEVTLLLIPEAVIAGTVSLPTSEAPDAITLQVFRQQVQEGRAHWVPAGGTRSLSDGQFRFADLPAGTYKLLTHELLDTDPSTSEPGGPLFGYPPVYYQGASDFGDASIIQVAAGQTTQVNLSLVKQPYFNVKIPVINAAENGLVINVYAHGHKGPGFSLGYNNAEHTIEGMLPNGSYTVEATSFGLNALSGMQTINIKGAPIDGPRMMLASSSSIPVRVKEEFTDADRSGTTTWNINGRNMVLKGPRRYLNVMLESADDFGVGRGATLRNPTGPGDEALVLDGVPAGSYWVRVNSSRGYAASVRSGNLDLQHEPLVVGTGGVSPIEITMRDDTAALGGTVEGVTPVGQAPAGDGDGTPTMTIANAPQSAVHVYCLPLPESGGQFTEIWVNPDGTFLSPGIAPGAYRLLAFDRPQPNLEYRNPDAMQAYDSKGPVVHLSGGQQEYVQLPLISTK